MQLINALCRFVESAEVVQARHREVTVSAASIIARSRTLTRRRSAA